MAKRTRPEQPLQLLELQCGIVAHCRALKAVLTFLAAGNLPAAVARLDQATKALDAIVRGHWHKVLGLDPGAGRAEVEAAYRRRLAESHPDRGGSAEQFQRVQEAYQAAARLLPTG